MKTPLRRDIRTRARLVLAVSLAIAASVYLAGCLRRQPEQAIRLTWWVTYAEDSAEYPTLQTLAETYTERTGTVIELVSVPWDDIAPRGAASRLSLALETERASGGQGSRGPGPDLWGPVPSTWLGPYAREGQVLALETGQVKDPGQYADIAMLASRWEGKQYALPVLMDSMALIYNRAMVADLPESFDELVEIAQSLTDADSGQWGLVMPLLSQYHVYPFMDGYGGYIFGCQLSVPKGQQCDLGDIGLNNEGSVRGIELLSDLFLGTYRTAASHKSVGALLPKPLADRESMHDDAVRLFVEGQAGMLLDGSWVLPQVEASGIEYDVSAIPELPGGTQAPRALTVVHVFAASASSAHPTETIDFMNFLCSPESIVALHEALSGVPVRRDILRQPPLRSDRTLGTWYDLAANGVPLPQAPELGYVWAPWARALDEAIPGLRPAQEALDQAVEQIRSYIEPE